MGISIYRLSVGTFMPVLGRLSVFLDKAERHAAEHDLAADTLLTARLASDMFPLSQQVRYASDIAKGASARLIGERAPAFPQEDRTIADLQARIAHAGAYLATITEGQMQDAEERPVSARVNGGDVTWPGRDYLLNLASPNFHFHATTAYAILRHAGVPLGKRDFLGLEG